MDISYYSLIENLSQEALRLLKIMTLAEKSVPLSLLTEVWENQTQVPPLDSLLAELMALGLLQKDETDEETIYRFDESMRESFIKWRQNNFAPVDTMENFASLSSSKDIFFDEVQKTPLPCALKQLQIENYQGIIKTGISDIPVDSQWIFLTGKNSFGKTTILQAIAIGLFGKFDDHKILTKDKCLIDVELKNQGDNQIYILGHPQFTHFVAYGSSRLQIQNQQSQNEISEKSTITYGLFNVDGILLNIEYELVIEYLKKSHKYKMIKGTLLKLLPSLSDIQINENNEVLYLEKENETSKAVYKRLPFEKLAAGYKSIIAMVGDMLIRFYKQQPQANEPRDLLGIVLIDELDLHFHPTLQRRLPMLLSELFPKIQFIVSTHSVIPFLGAPKNSVFLKMTRNKTTGIQLERVDIEIENLLPNSLLTSPIFDLEGEEIIQENNRNINDVRVEDTYDEIESVDKIKARLEAFEKSDKTFPDDLFIGETK
jgi:predicted ATP-binding protein involved in virulence